MTPSQGAAAPANETGVERRVTSPWSWQDAFGFVQAHEIAEAGRTIFCVGQASVDDEGRPLLRRVVVEPDDVAEPRAGRLEDDLEVVQRALHLRPGGC